MKKRVVALLMTAAMVMGALSGCGQTKNTPSSAENKSSAAEESKAETSKESEAQEEEEIVTVKWVIPAETQEDDDMVFAAINELLEERYHLQIEPIFVTWGEYSDKMKLMSTANEDYDLCFTANWANDFYGNVSREAFLPLNDLLKSDAAELLVNALPRSVEEYCAIATSAGQIYAVPNYQLIYYQSAAYIQKDLADEYGLDVDSIKELEDLEPFMEWVRDNKEGIWPYCETGVSSYAGHDYGYAGLGIDNGSDGFFNDVVTVRRDDETFTAQLSLDDPYSQVSGKKRNEWFKRGFIRSDAATVTDNSADVAANRYAITTAIAKPGGEVEMGTSRGEEYIQIPFGTPILPLNAGITTMTAINVHSKNPEAAIKLLGVMWSDKEIFNMVLYGLEGEHYTKVSENRIELIEDSGYNNAGLGWAVGNQFEAYLLPGQADDIWEVTAELNKKAPTSHLAGFVNDTSSVETEMAQVSAVVAEYGKRYTYTDDYDAWLAEYKEKLIAAGVEKCIEVTQQNIDAWRVANGK